MQANFPETSEITLEYPIVGDDGNAISAIVVRRLLAAELRDIRRARRTKQRRGIAAVQVATGLSWTEVRQIEQIDADAIDRALLKLDERYLAFGEPTEKV